ncbi:MULTISPECIES: ABC transporter substrate-binding protein [Rhizobium/Agrobacterium group]|jgi:ribose transport system substrate-binding protein|uniref:LacI family transcriptional regulator n=3 Tax=Rhizobium/Agrobacterium group TaxID=227290 RepID=A0AA92C4X9_RHIRH|nr:MULTISPECIES: ABC transporter substrate-binding protein [Rhizobium/Agrobacterium group]MDP9571985.1 ribose transport system substrate-binding protein [Agrobacterium larrymoorei]MQB19210.1 LacI family transcriptional regulator [Agrobacterium tumefaciens]PVE75619.1 LacI family transcriptional regulator [Sphingomonas sp. TPD3009]MDD1497546.1 ABC transporter substrate-binding protein [Agrobacterium sp. CNPSo 3708]PVE55522.1 LacI family transcriptional regulator [Rhizobium rhizogenes]
MKMKSKFLMATAALALMAAPALAQEKLKIGMTFQELNNPYFVSMQEALKEAAASIGADVVVTDAGHDVAKQISDVEDMLQQKIDILLLNPTDSAGIEAAVHAAKAAGVIVVAVDANANGPVDTFVGSKNRDAGYMSCKHLGEAVGGKGEVAILDGIPVVPILQRVEGCKAALAEFKDIKLVDTQNGRQDRSVALGVVENMIQSHPNLVGIFSVNDGGAMGALSAIQGSGKDIKLTSVDGAPEAVKAIADGTPFIETTAQFPRDQVRVGLAMALAQKWGARVVPKEVPIDVMVVDSKNAGEFSW